jgi:hypothetical protein
MIAWAQYEKWWEQCQKRSGQSFYGCDDVAGVTYVRGNVIMHQPNVRTARLPTNPNRATTTRIPSSIVRTNTVCAAVVVVCRIALHIPPTPNPSVVGPNTTLDCRYSAQGNRAAAALTEQQSTLSVVSGVMAIDGSRIGKHLAMQTPNGRRR